MKGQIVKILSNLYTVNHNGKYYECHSRGKFRNDKITPVVGDYVEFDDKQNYILEIKERKNILVRPLVSNIDQGLIVTSAKSPDFSTNLLDKLLLVMEYNKIVPIICITKWDLLTKSEKKIINTYISYYKKIGYKVLKNSNIWRIKRLFKNKSTVFTGQTGAGKSSLINRLDQSLKLETGEISKALGRGKHTTRHVELIELFGGKILDTPGFSSLDFTDVPNESIKNSFIEFKKYPCPYKDCNHTKEAECEVKKAVEDGKIQKSRYENYKKFLN